ncbi:MAG: glycosyltransferase [Hyphomicrobiales bacterium]|nr:glycosyltransferase [Hyphomicrobiales bacterium]
MQIRSSTQDGFGEPVFSIVMVTFARDHLVPQTIAQAARVAGDRLPEVEFILVDNNVDDIDRSSFLAPFLRWKYVKLGFNKGVSARNDGANAALGTFMVFVDDDAFLNPEGVLDRYEQAFAGNPNAAIVTARHIDHATGDTPRASFPHTDKSLPKDRPFKTFRFQGNGFALRRSVFEAVGPMSEDFFYGLEEIDYAYRVVDAGYEIYYEPACWVVEHNDPGGRKPRKDVEEMRLTNKLIISFKYLPAIYLPLNFLMFSAYVFYLNRGRINVFRSFGNFLKWARAHGDRRKPLGRPAIAYIERCGGAVWK